MKKIFLITIFSGMAICLFAQNKQITLPERPNRSEYIDYSTKETGFWCAAQTDASFGDTAFVGQLDIVSGYRFSEYLKIGIGVSPRIGLKSVPVFFDARGNIISQVDRMYAFYWDAAIGYSISDGLYLSPGLGMKFGGIRHNLLVGICYTLQVFKDADAKHFAGVRIGYEF